MEGSSIPVLRSPITVYKARRPRKQWTFWRVMRWTLLCLFLVSGAGAAGVAFFVYHQLSRITDLSCKGCNAIVKAQGNISIPAAGKPITALVVGYDHRLVDGPSRGRSDTLMLVRLDPHTKSMSLLSVPRDLVVNIPGRGRDKINAAWNYGGISLSLATVRQAFDNIQINYLVAVNFKGFTDTVNAFGGIYLDIDKRYYHKNTGVGDYSEIDLRAGYQLLSGDQALSYVRYRHTDSDFFRLARQQAFVREFKRKLDFWSGASNFVHVLGIIGKNVHIAGAKGHQPGPTTIIRYIEAIATVPPSRVAQVRLTGATSGPSGTYVSDSSQEIQQALAKFWNPDYSASTVVAAQAGGHAIGPSHHAAAIVSPAKLRVVTLNGSGVVNAAHDAATALKKAGWTLARVGSLPGSGGTLPTPDLLQTVVWYAPRYKAAAKKLQVAIGDAVPLALPKRYATLASTVDVVVATGQSFPKTVTPQPVLAVPKVLAPEVAKASTAMLPTWKHAQRRLGYPILYPTVVPTGTSYQEPLLSTEPDPRIYAIKGHGAAMHATACTICGSYASPYTWGLQWLSWTSPPILDNPTSERCINGRLWKLYFATGGTLHRIAVFGNDKGRCKVGSSLVWIDNTLDDHFSNQDIIAVAKGLRPVPR